MHSLTLPPNIGEPFPQRFCDHCLEAPVAITNREQLGERRAEEVHLALQMLESFGERPHPLVLVYPIVGRRHHTLEHLLVGDASEDLRVGAFHSVQALAHSAKGETSRVRDFYESG